MTADVVFVYGTLRRGASNHHRMDGACFLGVGRLRAKMFRVSWFPGIVLHEGPETVAGELYQVDPAHLCRLDAFEGLAPGSLAGDMYRRVATDVERDAGAEPVRAWVWEWTGPCDPREAIPSGDWLNRET
jgi:gamma-glutamylcyclotransferase (GGCT)/AIG2-like uncharacterized protein YtfP